MEDFYNVLNISSNSGNFKIAKSYKKMITDLVHSSKLAFDEEPFIKINQAYFVLSNEQGRKYYDMLYKCVIENTLHLNERTISMYTEIIQVLSEKGVKKANSLLGDIEKLKSSDLVKPIVLLFFFQGLFRNPGGSFIYSGFGGIILVIFSFSFFFKVIVQFNPGYFAFMILLGFLGIIIIISSCKEFTVSKLLDEIED